MTPSNTDWLNQCLDLYNKRFDAIEGNQSKIESSQSARMDKFEESVNTDISRVHDRIDDVINKQDLILDKMDGFFREANSKTTDNLITITEIKTKLSYWGTLGGIISGAAISWVMSIFPINK
ncbi:MAG: hypothetical protein M0R80_09690 [Proteobacteria bacterium]|jgi:hypothetical protein|nr:hypothetical protein [Pseudomonadota bacterium]